MHDTEGWKSLDTSINCLKSLIETVGDNIFNFDIAEILVIIVKSVQHLNRFVREIAFQMINVLFEASKDKNCDKTSSIYETTIPLISVSLTDSWPQVRLSASICARTFYQTTEAKPQVLDKYNSTLIPKMCLNRYYVAAGVRQYSNETWRLLFAKNGKEYLTNHSKEVSSFYCSQSMSEDQSDREAACHCIAEIGSKLAVIGPEQRNAFKPYI